MKPLLQQVHKALRHPQRVPGALLGRLAPASRFGPTWLIRPDGRVTFKEAGFVAAASPIALLARHNHEVAEIERLLEGRRFRRSLEVGCGFGRLSPTFAAFSDRHDAVDLDREALAAAAATYSGIEFAEAVADALPFEDGTFDVIVTWTVLQHVPPTQLEAAVRELQRVATAEALILICEETRLAAQAPGPRAHTWHRPADLYARLFAPWELVSSGAIAALEATPGLQSPGDVMVFERPGHRDR